MNDRELLELAAKAAGIEGKYFESENGIHIHTGIYRPGLDYYWNPLLSDSEALRLAVKLHMEVCCRTGLCEVYFDNNGKEDIISQDDGDDGELQDEEITRRAIVHAAAEIGRQME